MSQNKLTEVELDEALSHPVHDKMEDFKDKTYLKRLLSVLPQKDKTILSMLYEKTIVEYLGESYDELKKKADSFETRVKNRIIFHRCENLILLKKILIGDKIYENHFQSFKHGETKIETEITGSDLSPSYFLVTKNSVTVFTILDWKMIPKELQKENVLYCTSDVSDDDSYRPIIVPLFIFKDYEIAERFTKFVESVDRDLEIDKENPENSLSSIKEKFENTNKIENK
jgi:hypothetical protein